MPISDSPSPSSSSASGVSSESLLSIGYLKVFLNFVVAILNITILKYRSDNSTARGPLDVAKPASVATSLSCISVHDQAGASKTDDNTLPLPAISRCIAPFSGRLAACSSVSVGRTQEERLLLRLLQSLALSCPVDPIVLCQTYPLPLPAGSRHSPYFLPF